MYYLLLKSGVKLKPLIFLYPSVFSHIDSPYILAIHSNRFPSDKSKDKNLLRASQILLSPLLNFENENV